jgi:2-dehydropantoate 2-reductase
MDNARILVIGAGVNGSICAAALHNGGIDVTVLARGKRYEELQGKGIVIENPFNLKRSVTKVPVIDHLDPDDLYDYVLVIVRKNQVADLLPVLAANRSPNIVFMGNNLSGPDEFIKVLGKERVMMGAVYGAGKRDGSLIRAMVARSVAAPFGEVDGTITPRLKRLAGILRQAGFKVELSRQIVDFQTTHAAGVALIGKLTLKHGCDNYALARSSEDLRLFIAARREAYHVLHHLKRRIVPWTEAAIGVIPDFLQLAGMRALLGSKLGEVGLAYHCSQAPDEIHQMAMELQALVEQAGLPVPAIRKILKPD